MPWLCSELTLISPSDSRRSKRYDSYSDYSSRSRSRTPPRKERRKSTTEQVLGAVGLGGVVGALTGKKHDSRSRSRDRSRRRGRSSSSSRSRGGKRGKSRGKQEQITEALKAALLAGVGEAVRARKEPGGWGGEKGKRVLTAAISAGGVDGVLSHNRGDRDHSTRDVLGSALAGMATNRIVNGPRSKSRGGRDGSLDSRGRSQSRGGIGDLAAGGVLAATGKKLYDNVRSRSRGRAQSRGSYDSYGSRSPPRRARSQSVSAGLARGLSAVGLGSVADKVDPDRRKSRSNDYDDRNGSYRDSRDVGPLAPSAPAPGFAPGFAPGYPPPGPGYEGAPRSVSASRAPQGAYALDYKPHHTGDPDTDSDSDLGSSSDEEKEKKKGRKKSMITAGLATVATIHAAHNVYQSVEKRQARKEALKEGDITQAQARRMKNKNRMQDAASIGIAALGLKGAYSEWKEMKEHREEMHEKKETLERHSEKREARRRKAAIEAEHYRQSGYTGSLPNLHAPTPPPNGGYYSHDVSPYSPTPPRHPQQHPQSAYPQSAAHYYDDNPYASFSAGHTAPPPEQYPPQQFPPPPMGPARPQSP